MDQEIQQLKEELASLLALVKQQQARIRTLELIVLTKSQEESKLWQTEATPDTEATR